MTKNFSNELDKYRPALVTGLVEGLAAVKGVHGQQGYHAVRKLMRIIGTFLGVAYDLGDTMHSRQDWFRTAVEPHIAINILAVCGNAHVGVATSHAEILKRINRIPGPLLALIRSTMPEDAIKEAFRKYHEPDRTELVHATNFAGRLRAIEDWIRVMDPSFAENDAKI